MVLQNRGYVGWGDVDSYGVVLNRDRTYTISVQGDDPRADLDLFVYDENDNLVDDDQRVDRNAYCQITPRWTGPFQVFVKASRGGGGYLITVID